MPFSLTSIQLMSCVLNGIEVQKYFTECRRILCAYYLIFVFKTSFCEMKQLERMCDYFMFYTDIFQ